MAEIKTICPRCSKRYWVDEAEIGNEIECPKCGTAFVIEPMAASDKTQEIPMPPGSLWSRKPEPKASPSDELVFPGLGMILVRVEPGAFLMGSPGGESDESPPHKVTLTYPYHIGKYPVTQHEFLTVMGTNPSHFASPKNPVEQTDWHVACDFCRKLTEMARLSGLIPEGSFFRLPTEAEWEFACRAPDPDDLRNNRTKAYFFGDDPGVLADYAWFEANSGLCTHPVGLKRPNTRKIFDMHGNVGEWCYDWFAPYPAMDVTDPCGPSDGRRKVRRGGCWASIPARCRSASRIGVLPNTRTDMLGFRVVLATDGAAGIRP